MPQVTMSQEIRSVRAALSMYVGGALPPDLVGVAVSNGLPVRGWVFAPSAAVAGRFEDLNPDLATAGDIVRSRAQQAGLHMLVPGDPGWPAGTAADDLPPCLWVDGDPDVAGALRKAVTVTGSADASAYGLHVGSDLGVALSVMQWTVVTGADVRGVDAAAARGARTVDGRLVLVTARGHDRFRVPPVTAGDSGRSRHALVSPVPSSFDLTRDRFRVQQHLLGSFGAATVVVEEKQDGPALAVGRTAAARGRAVCAVPGPVTSGLSGGCHQLITRGEADLVADAGGVLGVLARRTDHQPADGQVLYRISGSACWDDGRRRTRPVPEFHILADSPRAAADQAFDLVFAALSEPAGETLLCGVIAPDGSYEPFEVFSTS